MKKPKHDLICCECDKPATMEIEDVTMSYPIDEDGDFGDGETIDAVDDSGRLYCDEHYPY